MLKDGLVIVQNTPLRLFNEHGTGLCRLARARSEREIFSGFEVMNGYAGENPFYKLGKGMVNPVVPVLGA